MKLVKTIMSIILVAALLFGMVPYVEIPVSAEEADKFQSVVSIAEDELALSNQENSGSDGISRIQWVQMLVTTFDMYVEEDNYPDNYYSDVFTEDEFYRDLMVAIEFGVISLEPGLEFRPHDPATREFAASTLNYCVGFILDENQDYTFEDVEAVADLDSAQVAVNRGWLTPVDGCFVPELGITSTEADRMIGDAVAYLAEYQEDPDHVNVVEYAAGVIEVPMGTDVGVNDGGQLEIVGCPVTIQAGDVFAVYEGDMPFVFKALDVTVVDGITVITHTTEGTGDAITELDYQGSVSADLESFEGADATTFTVSGQTVYVGPTVYGIDYNRGSKVLTASKTVDLMDGVKATITAKISNLDLVRNENKGKGQTSAKIVGDVTLTTNVKADALKALGLQKDILLGEVSFALNMVKVKLYAQFSLDGEVNLVWKGSMGVGFRYSNADGFSMIGDFTKSSFTFTAEVAVKAGLKLEASVNIVLAKADVWVTLGAKMRYRLGVYDSGTPTRCSDLVGYMYSEAGVSAKISLVSEKFSKTKVIYDESNSPKKVHYHYEDGVYVLPCTRGSDSNVTWNYYTEPSSRYFNPGNGQSSYQNSRGEPVIIYTYELDEENNATITGYNGYAGAVNIPKTIDGYTVTAIGDKAFMEAGLYSVVIPDTVVSIGNRAFDGCVDLVSVDLPDELVRIGYWVFRDCVSLTEIHIPKTLTEVDTYGANWRYPFEGCINLTTVTFDEGITAIPGCLLAETGLKSVDVPDTVTSIGERCFANCEQLETVHLSDNLISIGYYAFKDCVSLTEINIPKTLAEVDTYGWNYYYPFEGCSSLSNVDFAEGITAIPYAIFGGCPGLVEVTIPDTVTSVGERSFAGCTALKTVNFPISVTSIGACAFAGCTSLENAVLPIYLSSIGYRAFRNCVSLTSVFLPKTLTEVDTYGLNYYYPFEGCENISQIVFEPDATAIPDNIFGNCFTKDFELMVPEGITYIGSRAFAGCTGIKSVTLPISLTSIGEYAFAKTGIAEIVIPETVSEIGVGVFNNCSNLCDVSWNEILKTIPKNTFENCISLEEIVIPDTVTDIASESFAGCSKLSKITWSNSLNTIGGSAFNNCDSISVVELPNLVTELGANAFYDCDALTTVYIPDSVTKIGSSIFYDCDALTNVRLSKSLTKIPEAAFEHCDVLEIVTIPRNVTEIDEYAFKDCVKLADVFIPKATVKINANSFSYPDIMTIYGLSGTYAETYANTNGFPFNERTIPATEAILDQTEVKLFKGKKLTLNLTVKPEDFTDDIVWKSSDSEVVTVSETGELKGVAVGSATIKVTVGGVSASCKVEVVQPVTSITMNKTSLTLDAMQTYQLTARANPSDAENREVVWSTSDETVASVTVDGLVTAHKKGTAIITVMAQDGSGVTKKCTVTVANNGYVVTDPTLMESSHNYSDGCSDFWIYTYDEAVRLEVTFDAQTMIEDGFDYLHIYDGDGNLVGTYTGAELAGQMVEIPGNTVKIQIKSDDSGNEWGFKVSNINPIIHVHAYSEVITVPTCTAQGFSTFTCECGESYIDNYVDPVAHNYGSWIVVKVPTCTETGIEQQNCSNCDAFETREVEALGHSPADPVEENRKEATCTEEGAYDNVVYCTVCKTHEISRETLVVPVIGHSFTHYVSNDDATCTDDGTKTAKCDNCDAKDTVVDEGSSTGHQWDDGVISKEPAVGVEGEMTYTCGNCGETKTEVIPALPEDSCKHAETKLVNQKDATCSAIGYTGDLVCESCDEILEKGTELEKVDHEVVIEEAVAPTCTENGLTEGKYCAVCEEILVKQETVAELGHSYGEWEEGTEATCTEGGVELRCCSACDAYETRETVANGHSFTEYISNGNATCTADGTKTATCDNCDAVDTVVDQGSMIAHDWDDGEVTKEPAIGVEGEKTYTCGNCGKIETAVIPPLTDEPCDHSSIRIEGQINATCTAIGYSGNKICVACGEMVEIGSETAALGHTEAEIPAVAATCTATGLTKGSKCSVCGEILVKQEVTDKLAHTEVEIPAVAATCTATGLTKGSKCSVCGEILVKQEVTDKLAHTEEVIPGKAASETETGLTEGKKCSVCGEILVKQEVIDKLKPSHVHEYKAVVTEATCTAKGYTTYTCSCGESYTADETPVKDHTYGEWVTVKQPTTAAAGEMQRTCTGCGKVESKSLAKLSESFADVSDTDYFQTPVAWAVTNDITKGLSADSFGPAQACTREQVVTFLWRAAGSPKVAGTLPFTDVKTGDWFYDAVLWAKENGITAGVSATQFGVGTPCSRAMVVTLLWRTAQQPKPASSTNPFGDVAASQYYYNAVLWAVEKNITQGTGAGVFSPDTSCTRAQIVTFLYRYFTN